MVRIAHVGIVPCTPVCWFVGPQSDELKDLVEDKEIAACAVAFVVNGTRKGIVPLCADVASLMRSKRRYNCLK